MQEYIVASLSGGKDSTAMVLEMIARGERIDEVLCCDTYKEFPAMYRHLDKVKAVIRSHGIKITELRNEKHFDYWMFEHKVNRRNKELDGKLGYSWAGPLSRWCTSKLKIDVIEKYMTQLRKKYKVITCTGIAADEGYRLVRDNNMQEGQRHPLVEWGWTEADCLKYCYDHGYDWEGLYEIFDRVSCWCCPLQSLEDLRRLRKHFPELWEELMEMDGKTWRQMKSTYSVEELEVRFALEDERQAQGLSINNKEFFTVLKKRLS